MSLKGLFINLTSFVHMFNFVFIKNLKICPKKWILAGTLHLGAGSAAPAFLGTNLEVLGVSRPCDQIETYHSSNEDKIEHTNETCKVDEQSI